MRGIYEELHICPCCGVQFKIEKNNFISQDTEDDIMTSIIDGSYFDIFCPYCHHREYTDNTIMFKDKNRRYALLYFAPDYEKVINEDIVELYTSYKYERRRVKSQLHFREKLMLYRHHLDDRIVEIMKAHIYYEWQFDLPDINIFDILLWQKNDNLIFYIYLPRENKIFKREFDYELYENIKNTFLKEIDNYSLNEDNIDFKWGMEVYEYWPDKFNPEEQDYIPIHKLNIFFCETCDQITICSNDTQFDNTINCYHCGALAYNTHITYGKWLKTDSWMRQEYFSFWKEKIDTLKASDKEIIDIPIMEEPDYSSEFDALEPQEAGDYW